MASEDDTNSSAKTNKRKSVFGFVWRCISSSREVFSNARANDWMRMCRGISCPISVKDATRRLRFNLRDFAPNYQVLMLLSMFVSVVCRPWSFLTVFAVVVAWHYVINVRSKDVTLKRGANEEPIVVTVRMQGMLLLAVSAILIFGFTSFSATFVTCVSIGAGVCVSHSVMKAPLTENNSPSDGGDSPTSPSLLAEFQEYTGSTLSTFNRGAGFEKVIPSQVYEYGGKALDGATAGVSTISSYFGQAILQRTGSNVSNNSSNNGGGNGTGNSAGSSSV